MDNTTLHVITITSLWLGYFAIHSITASLQLKHAVATHFNSLMPAYRLLFNALAILLLIPLLWLSIQWHGEPLWHWPPPLDWITSIISILTVIAFFYSLRYYDMREFTGLRQWCEQSKGVEDQENFVIGGFHRYVRHPWYSMAIILLWCREPDPVMLTNSIMITLYFMIGLRLEERKLCQYHGEVYRRYAEKVPALLPRPWRYLTRKQANILLTLSETDDPKKP